MQQHLERYKVLITSEEGVITTITCSHFDAHALSTGFVVKLYKYSEDEEHLLELLFLSQVFAIRVEVLIKEQQSDNSDVSTTLN